jgi:hypothetical protein
LTNVGLLSAVMAVEVNLRLITVVLYKGPAIIVVLRPQIEVARIGAHLFKIIGDLPLDTLGIEEEEVEDHLISTEEDLPIVILVASHRPKGSNLEVPADGNDNVQDLKTDFKDALIFNLWRRYSIARGCMPPMQA